MTAAAWIIEFELIEHYWPQEKSIEKRKRSSSLKGIKRLDMFDRYQPENSRMSTTIQSQRFDIECEDQN